jgi:protoporphyrinogen oxidase
VRIEAEHVVSTTDLRSLVRAFGETAPAKAREGADALRYRDFLVVALILDGEDFFPDNWIYVHEPGVKVGRVQNFNNWSAEMVPEPGRTCLGMEYFCFDGDSLWNMPDEDLIAMAFEELGKLNLVHGATLADATVVRMPKAYPVYDAKYREHLDDVRAFIDRVPNLHSVGRNGMHKYNNQDHSMYTAMLAVDNMLGNPPQDVWAVNTDFEYHEEQRLTQPDPGAASVAGA